MNGKTPISALQELMMARKQPLPCYIEEPFGSSFKCTVRAGGVTGTGISSTKKSAKHESAKNALEQLTTFSRVFSPTFIDSSPSRIPNNFRNYVGELNEYSSKHHFQAPDYQCMNVSATGEFYFKCLFLGKEMIGKGMNKKDAKQDCARKMWELVKSTNPDPVMVKLQETQKLFFGTKDKEEIIAMYKKLSVKNEVQSRSETTTTTTTISIDRKLSTDASVETLKEVLSRHNVQYVLSQLQPIPCIMCVKIKGTDLHFMANGCTREEATRKVLKEVVDLARDGFLQTKDLITFD